MRMLLYTAARGGQEGMALGNTSARPKPMALAADNTPAGLLAVEMGEPHGVPSVFIHEIARNPSLPEGVKGVGTEMLSKALHAVHERFRRPPKVVQLLVDVGNTEAIEWYRRRTFRDVNEIVGATPIYQPSAALHRRRSGGSGAPLQLCLQADGGLLFATLRASAVKHKSQCGATVYEPHSLRQLRRTSKWRAALKMVDAAHHASRGVSCGGSGRKAAELLPPRQIEERVMYVIASAPTTPAVQRMPSPTPAAPSQALGPAQDRGSEMEIIDMEAEFEEEYARMGADEVGAPPPGDNEPSPPSTPTPRSPTSSPETSPRTSPAQSPASTRPPSPATLRRQEVVCADCTEGDEDEPIEEMVERLGSAIAEAEAQHERKKRLQARDTQNARKGLAHGLRVGEVEGIEHGAGHARRRVSEGARMGWAHASEVGVGPHPRPRGLGGGCAACRYEGGCTLKHVFLGECGCNQINWETYLEHLEHGLGVVEKLVPKVELDASVPLSRWCPCRRVARMALEAVRQRRAGQRVGEEGWEAVRMVAAGLLPESVAAESFPERARRQLEGKLARAVIELQQAMLEMLQSYRDATRGARGRKKEALEAWCARQQQRRTVRARMLKLLQPWAARRRTERKRRREALVDTVLAVRVAAEEDHRRKTARAGGETACTRAGGLHKLGTGVYTSHGTGARKRRAPWGWEAGDVRRTHTAGWSGDGRGVLSGLSGVPLKADGTPDRRYRINKGGGRPGAAGGGGRGEGGGDSGGDGGGSRGGLPSPSPLSPPPSPPTRAGGATRRRTTTSRWQPYALGKMRAAWRDGAT